MYKTGGGRGAALFSFSLTDGHSLWEEAEVEMFAGKSINMVSVVHVIEMMDDRADAREARDLFKTGGRRRRVLYIYIKARSTNCPSGFCSHHSSSLEPVFFFF